MYDDHRPRIKNVFLYLRKSTRDEDERQIRSIDDQRTECLALADRLGLNIVETIEEDRSARRPKNRPAFSQMLKELSYLSPERRQADGILAWHPDRLTRNALEAGQILQMIDDQYIKDLFFPAYSFHNDISGIEHLTNEFARAKGYTDRLASVVIRGVKNREKEGAMVYPIKFGYEKKREFDNPAKCSLFPIPNPRWFPVVKRLFNLALEGYPTQTIHATLQQEFAALADKLLSRSALHACLVDPFYYGLWVIKPNSKNERTIDLRTLTLADGTTFTPVITYEQHEQIRQRLAGGSAIKRKPNKRISPLPRLVRCAHCGSLMYASYRKIKRAGGRLEEQLGYECQYRHANGTRCPQKRVKAEDLLNFIETTLAQHSQPPKRKHYYSWLYASETFINKQIKQQQIALSHIKRSHQALSQKRKKLINQKADLVTAQEFDSDAKAHYTEQLKAIDKQLHTLQLSRKADQSHQKRQVLTFNTFLELFLNLPHYWHHANYQQKSTMAQTLLLNLHIRDNNIQSINWKTPFVEQAITADCLYGRATKKQLESWFTHLWCEVSKPDQTNEFQQIIKLNDALKQSGLKPKYRIGE